MPEQLDLLVEIGTEELPPKDLRRLEAAFLHELERSLADAGLRHGSAVSFATPRRLAALVEALAPGQPARRIERRGPAVDVAFDEAGKPTRAAEGFARSCGVAVAALERLETDKGTWLVFRATEEGQPTAALLPALVTGALERLPIARRMRWGSGKAEFVRPVQWAVILLGATVIEAEILGVRAGNETRGHRFHHPGRIPLSAPREYPRVLRESGRVMAAFAEREALIRRELAATARELGGEVRPDPALVEEVASMVEWPVAVAGRFDEEFLALPTGVLVATMQDHQRYFPVFDPDGALLPHFITVANIDSRNPESVRRGNERVIRPRLKDAAFFFANDLRVPLGERLETLGEVVFQEQLGSLADKCRRVSSLARQVAAAMGQPPEAVKDAARAGQLSKCDLVTEMVGEFPELQGYMGRQYAERAGERPAVATALEEAYWPRFAGDRIPVSAVGRAVAIADRLDTLAGIFAIGSLPTGEKDPYALRRAALGTLRIMIEGELPLDLPRLVQAALNGQPGALQREGAAAELLEFITERLRAYFLDQGVPPDVFAAVAARRPARPLDFALRVRAVEEFRRRPEAASLATANKRIQNILRQADGAAPDAVDDGLLRADAEWDLAAKLVGVTPHVNELLSAGDYTSALSILAGLRESIDAFFDNVKVMADDAAVRDNRLALLNRVGTLFLQAADISLLQSTGEPAPAEAAR